MTQIFSSSHGRELGCDGRPFCCHSCEACDTGGYKKHDDHSNDARVQEAAKFAVEKASLTSNSLVAATVAVSSC